MSHFDTSQAKNLSKMFYYASGLLYLDISNFDTSNVLDMSFLFYAMGVITTVFLLDKKLF